MEGKRPKWGFMTELILTCIIIPLFEKMSNKMVEYRVTSPSSGSFKELSSRNSTPWTTKEHGVLIKLVLSFPATILK